MEPARWRQLETLYSQAIEMKETQRAAFLRAACGGDEELQHELEGLLAVEPQAASFLEKAALREIAVEFEATAPSWVGRQIGNYEFVSLAGAGGMGEVYRARDTKLKRDVAIKILRDEFSLDPDWVSRFRREAQLLASLNHPSVAAIYDLEEADGHLFLILELVDGETLADRIRRGPIAVEEALKIALQIAEALESAHEKSIIHRDLKPANIKVTAEGKVKVLDFGLAKALLGDAGGSLSNSPTMSMAATQQGVILGTAAYMSPEQARGQAVDKRTDVWAFGCVLFEMLSGHGTFGGKTVSDVIAAVLKTAPDWSSLPADLHPRILHLLERCLEKEPADRHQGMVDARVEIKKVLADAGGVPARPQTGTRSGSRYRLLWISAVIVVAFIASILTWVFNPKAPAAVVEIPFSLPEGQSLGLPRTSSLAVSPDGTRLVYISNNQLYLGDINSLASKAPWPIPGAHGGIALGGPVFSPDGQWLAYVDVGRTGGSAIKKILVSGGTPVTLVEDSPVPKADVSWSEDDTILFVTPEAILRIPATRGTPAILIKPAKGEALGSPRMLPGGKSLMFSATTATGENRWDSAKIFVQALKSDDRTLVWEGGGDPRYLTTGHVLYAQGSTLFVLPFDIDGLKKKGGPIPLYAVKRGRGGARDTGNYDISESGTLVYVPAIAAIAQTDGVLASVDRNGEQHKLKKVEPRQYRSPRLSPDGHGLVVEVIGKDGLSSIWIYDMSGDSEIRPLTQTGNNSHHPIWTPDSKSVTFASHKDGASGIYTQRASGGAAPELLLTGERGLVLVPESWSPDGRTLSFRKEWNIWTFSMDTHTSTLFHDSPTSNDFGSVFSPDGTYIAYTNQGLKGIQVMRFPAGESYPISDAGESGVMWSRQNELFYRQADEGKIFRLSEVDVSTKGTSPEFLGRHALLFQDILTYPFSRDYDVASDGKRFVMIVPADASAKPPPPARDRIQIIVNWSEQLKALVSAR